MMKEYGLAVNIVRQLNMARRGSNAFPTGHYAHEDVYANAAMEAFVSFFSKEEGHVARFDAKRFRNACKRVDHVERTQELEVIQNSGR
jgi:hypothetical protein